MNGSTLAPRQASVPPTEENLQLQQERCDRDAVIENDWVPAIRPSAMHHATPVRMAAPLRPQWYADGIKKLMFKVVRLGRQTA